MAKYWEVIYKYKEDQEIRKTTCYSKKNAEAMVIQMKTNPSIEFAIINDVPKKEWEDQYVKEIMEQKKALGIECPKIDKIEIVSYGTVEM